MIALKKHKSVVVVPLLFQHTLYPGYFEIGWLLADISFASIERWRVYLSIHPAGISNSLPWVGRWFRWLISILMVSCASASKEGRKLIRFELYFPFLEPVPQGQPLDGFFFKLALVVDLGECDKLARIKTEYGSVVEHFLQSYHSCSSSQNRRWWSFKLQPQGTWCKRAR